MTGHLVCSGCGAAPSPDDPYPFRCPKAGVGDVDHVLVRDLDLAGIEFPRGGPDQPFVRYRRLLHSYRRAVEGGLTDDAFTALVGRLDDAVRAVDGRGFAETPMGRADEISDRLGFRAGGGVWVKDETGNVAGSHKGRHLFGVLLHLEVAERLGLADPAARPDLAIASCGNAALAAAVLARAAGRRLKVFVPVEAAPAVLRALRALDADVVVCEREEGVPGDPCYSRLQDAIGRGAIPFTCQGSENGLVIEGGETLAYEIAAGLAGGAVDHLVVQVGGGALASACIQGLQRAVDLGALPRMPRIHAVQTEGGHPLDCAYERVRKLLPQPPSPADVDEALHVAATHRSAFMTPWPQEPHSLATGILDDETYDWQAVVGGLLRTGGQSVVVSEALIAQAHELGRTTGIPAEPTGTAGLAGLLQLVERGVVGPEDRAVVLFTGVAR